MTTVSGAALPPRAVEGGAAESRRTGPVDLMVARIPKATQQRARDVALLIEKIARDHASQVAAGAADAQPDQELVAAAVEFATTGRLQ